MSECDEQITDCSGDGCVEVSGDGSDSDEMPSTDSPATSTDSPITGSPTFTDPPLTSTDASTQSTDGPTPSTDAPIPPTDAPTTDMPSTDSPMEEEEFPVNTGEEDGITTTVFEDGEIPPVDIEEQQLPKAREPKVASISDSGDEVRPSSASLLSNLLASLYEEEKQHKSS